MSAFEGTYHQFIIDTSGASGVVVVTAAEADGYLARGYTMPDQTTQPNGGPLLVILMAPQKETDHA